MMICFVLWLLNRHYREETALFCGRRTSNYEMMWGMLHLRVEKSFTTLLLLCWWHSNWPLFWVLNKKAFNAWCNLNISPPAAPLLINPNGLLSFRKYVTLVVNLFFVCQRQLKTSCLGNTAAVCHPTASRPYFLKIKDIFHILWPTPNAF